MRRKTFSSRVILIFFSFVVFLIFSFALFQKINMDSTNKNIIERNLEQLVLEKKQVLNLRMKQVEIEVKNLADWLYGYTKEDFNIQSANYQLNNGIIVDEVIEGKTSLFVTKKTHVDNEVRKVISLTKNMEDKFIKTLNSNEDIVCVYVISKEGVLRVYPYMDIDAFSYDHDFTKDYYYQEACEKNNPSKEVVWTEPYYDWADRGWVVTCAYPVYIDNDLSYVVFADVTLNFLQETMEDFQINKFGYGFIINYDGEIIYHPEYEAFHSNKGEKFYGSIFDLIKSESFKSIAEDMAGGNAGQAPYYDDRYKNNRLITYAPIDRLKWVIGFDVNIEEYDINVQSYMNRYFFVPIAIATLVLVIGYYLLKKMSKPIETLSAGAEKMASGEFIQFDRISATEDIDTIANSLNILSSTVKEYMNNLIKANRKLEAVFNSISGILYIVDKNYNIIIMNNYGKQISKKIGKEPIGSSCHLLFKGAKSPCSNCPITETLKTSKESFKEMQFNQDIYHVWTFPILNDNGNVDEVVVYSMKVTEKAIIEKEFYQREKLAAVGQMAAGVTHELKNPLSVIKGCNYLLKNTIDFDKLDNETKMELEEIIEDIDNSIDRAQNIIANLLEFSRKASIEKERVDLKALIQQILILNKKYIVEGDIELLLEFKDESLNTYANLDSMKHIFINIIENAIQSMPNGGVLKVTGKVLDDENVEVEIEDTGYGIDDKILDKIFKPFFTTKYEENGTGLGLWIVKNELKKNNGHIEISSILGKGTKVKLIFQKYIEEE